MSTSILHRYLLAFILVFYTCGLYAQSDRLQRFDIYTFYAQKTQVDRVELFNDILILKDMESCKRLIPLITQEDIDYMSDSTLLYYYYWASRCASENDQIEECIAYLLKAKELCEAKTGIHNQLYFEIILTLGEMCEKKGDEVEALLWYEEGIVKALPYQNYKDETLAYINRIRKNAADIYETNGHPDMARYLRPFDYEGSFDYACNLLEQALLLNNKGKVNEAISLLDEAGEIFRKQGEDGERMMQALYRAYLMCYASAGDIKQIDNLLNSQKKLMFQGENESYLISDMSEVISSFITIHKDVETVIKYCQFVLDEHDKTSQSEVNSVDQLIKTIIFYFQTLVRIYNELGLEYLNSGEYEQSNEMFMTAENIILSYYSNKSLQYSDILYNKGYLAMLQGNLKEGRKLVNKSIRVKRKAYRYFY